MSNTPIFIRTSEASTSLAGSLVVNNAQLTNVPIAVGVLDGATVLEGSTGSMTIESWGQGNVYSGTSSTGTFVQGDIVAATKPASLLDSTTGFIVGRGHPQYADYAVDQIIQVKSNGAKGDGVTDDTAALQAIFAKVRLSDILQCKQTNRGKTVFGMWNHLFRCGNVHRHFNAADSCWDPNDRRGGMFSLYFSGSKLKETDSGRSLLVQGPLSRIRPTPR